MEYRFPGTGCFGATGKRAQAAFDLNYGEAAGAAFRQVKERFFPESIDEVALLSGAFQLLAQGDTELAADWMEDLATYQDRAVKALDEAGFGPAQNWRCQWEGVARRYREAAKKIRLTLDHGAEEWVKPEQPYGNGIYPATRRDVMRLVQLVDATYCDTSVLNFFPELDVMVEVPGPLLRGTFHLPTMKAHAVARLLEEHPELLVNQPAPAKKAKTVQRRARHPRITAPVWVRVHGRLIAGGIPLFPDFVEEPDPDLVRRISKERNHES